MCSIWDINQEHRKKNESSKLCFHLAKQYKFFSQYVSSVVACFTKVFPLLWKEKLMPRVRFHINFYKLISKIILRCCDVLLLCFVFFKSVGFFDLQGFLFVCFSKWHLPSPQMMNGR